MELCLLYERYLRDKRLKIPRRDILLAIDSLPNSNKRALFEDILNQRLNQITEHSLNTASLNIAGKLSCSIYLETMSQQEGRLTATQFQIEQLALAFFDGIADLWCEYEIHCLLNKQTHPSYEYSPFSVTLSYDESCYRSQLINNVEQETKRYYTLYSSAPLLLSEAILLSNLCTFIKQHKWYEMLYSLELSTQGTHFLLMTESTQAHIPLLVSTARIQYWHQRHDWLYFSAFFQSSVWQPYIEDNFEEKLRQHIKLNSHGCIDANSITTLDSSMSELISDKKQICEILRLTTSGNSMQCTFIIYLAQKHIMALLNERNFTLGFVVIEQPLMMYYYASLSEGEYLYTAISNLQDTGNPTYKGLWLIDKLHRQLSQTTYKEYKQRVLTQKKHLRKNTIGDGTRG